MIQKIKWPDYFMNSYEFHRAQGFAAAAHSGQFRKGSGLPYVVHPLEVGLLLAQTGHEKDVIIAGILHDVLEDTHVTFTTIVEAFGPDVAVLVQRVTDPPKVEGESRKERKAKVVERYYQYADAETHSVKLADIVSNTNDLHHLGDFADKFVEEKQALLAVLTRGHPRLQELARTNLFNYHNKCS
jgi:(p)ppGpp synthase/HD superfamily hydrolase